MTISVASTAVKHISISAEVSKLLELGCKLFPCRPDTKRPAHKGWQEQATSDPAQLTQWLAEGYILGIYCAGSGFIGVEVDIKNDDDAWEWFAKWMTDAGFSGLSKPFQFSKSGGPHYAIRTPDDWNSEEHGGIKKFKTSDFRKLEPGEKAKEIFSIRNRGLVIAAGTEIEGQKYKLAENPVIHPWLPKLGAALDKAPETAAAKRKALGKTLETPIHDVEAGVKNCTVEEVQKALEILLPTGAFDDEWAWTQAIWRIKRSLGIAGLDLVEMISYSDDQDLRWKKWDYENPSVKDPHGALSLIKDAWKVVKTDPMINAAAKRYDAAVGAIKQDNWKQEIQAKAQEQGLQGMPQLPQLPEVPSIAPEQLAKLIKSSAKFVADFVAPSYLLDGILQKHFCYSLTAATGAGKTAIALRLAAHVALGQNLGDRDVERGRVLYFAAENYVDVQARWIAMAQHIGFDVNTIEAFFVSGATRLSEIADRITAEAQAIGNLALVVVDTSAATFEGSDENSNVDALTHAKRIRSLTELQGNPTVLVLCHPVKSANNDNLQPRGGGAFIAEIDGNLCARKGDSSVELHWFGKFRGMDFAPMHFQLATVTAKRLKDARGRNMPTVLATPIDERAKQALAASERSDQDRVLRAVEEWPGESGSEIARRLDWKMGDGKPYAVRVRRAAERLAGDGLLIKHRGNWALTSRGEKELNKLDLKAMNNAVQTMPPIPTRNVQ